MMNPNQSDEHKSVFAAGVFFFVLRAHRQEIPHIPIRHHFFLVGWSGDDRSSDFKLVLMGFSSGFRM